MRFDKDAPRHVDVGLGQDVVIVGVASMELAVDFFVEEEDGTSLTGAEEMVVSRTGARTTTDCSSYLLTAITTLRGRSEGREREKGEGNREKDSQCYMYMYSVHVYYSLSLPPLSLSYQLAPSVNGGVDHPQQTRVFLVHFSRPHSTVHVHPLVHATGQKTPRLLK